MILEKVKKAIGVPVLTDVHEDTPLKKSQVWLMCCKLRHFYADKLILFKMWLHARLAGEY